jgi:outer membrane receptor protein involved in Fe transport
VIGTQELQDSGAENIGEFLQELPFMSGSPLSTTTSFRGEGGSVSRGISTIELRGLGAERTLVLLNGRRFVPGGNGASGVVDINMIPMSVIQRVEILRSGASVEYGADAVAGVVNIITREDTRGLELQAQTDVTSRGDAETYIFSAVYGKQLDRGNFLLAADYADQPSLGKGERGFSSERLTVTGPDNTIISEGSSAPPQGNFRTSQGRLTLIEGADGDSIDDFRPFTDDDRYNFNPLEDLLQASERFSVYGQGSYDLSETIGLFGEALYQQRESSQTLAPLPFFTNRETDVAVSADNVFNPFGEELDDVRRRMVEAGQRSFAQDNSAWRVVLGLEGEVSEWFWDVSATQARNETDQTQSGDLLDSRLRLALGPSFYDQAGNAVCGTPGAPVSGCVPLNVFGGAGSITPEMLQYIGTGLNDSGYNEQTVFNANIAGVGSELPAGEIRMAFGYEYRDESAADFPDPQTVLGNTTGSARSVTQGSFSSNEIYSEFGVPLLRDQPMAQELDLDMGVRWVNFSNFDPEWLYELGLHHQPVENVQLRATYSSAFRAPNVRELFGGFAQSNPIIEDPCADFSQLSPVQIERCVAQGVPADGSFNQSGASDGVTGNAVEVGAAENLCASPGVALVA